MKTLFLFFITSAIFNPVISETFNLCYKPKVKVENPIDYFSKERRAQILQKNIDYIEENKIKIDQIVNTGNQQKYLDVKKRSKLVRSKVVRYTLGEIYNCSNLKVIRKNKPPERARKTVCSLMEFCKITYDTNNTKCLGARVNIFSPTIRLRITDQCIPLSDISISKKH